MGLSTAALLALVDSTPVVHAAIGPVIAAAFLPPDPLRSALCPECVDWSRLVLWLHVLRQASRALHVRKCLWLDATHCCRLAGALYAMMFCLRFRNVNVIVGSSLSLILDLSRFLSIFRPGLCSFFE